MVGDDTRTLQSDTPRFCRIELVGGEHDRADGEDEEASPWVHIGMSEPEPSLLVAKGF
jgi:hypothetical protein